MQIDIERVVAGGEGLGRIDGEVILVPYALPGDQVEVADTGRRAGARRGRIQRLITPSPHRRAANCSVFGRCGGCTWLHFAYPAQADAKREIVTNCFRRIAGLDVEVRWAGDETLRLGYRTRATFHGLAGCYGFYEARSHRIVDINGCPLCHPRLNSALEKLRAGKFMGEFDVTVNPEGEEVLVWTRDPVQGLHEVFPQSNNHRVNSERNQFLFDGVPIVCGAFSQASLLLNRTLRALVRESIGEAKTVLDLYCGSGNFSIDLPHSVRVFGLDHHAPSIAAAQQIGLGQYAVGDEATFVRALARDHWDVVVLDPPREGAKAIAAALAHCAAGRLVYVSCDPATLARDAKTLVGLGRRLISVTAVDLFPNTAHIESVAVFGPRGD